MKLSVILKWNVNWQKNVTQNKTCKMSTKQTHKYTRECFKRTFCEHWSNHILIDTNSGNTTFMDKVKNLNNQHSKSLCIYAPWQDIRYKTADTDPFNRKNSGES